MKNDVIYLEGNMYRNTNYIIMIKLLMAKIGYKGVRIRNEKNMIKIIGSNQTYGDKIYSAIYNILNNIKVTEPSLNKWI